MRMRQLIVVLKKRSGGGGGEGVSGRVCVGCGGIERCVLSLCAIEQCMPEFADVSVYNEHR